MESVFSLVFFYCPFSHPYMISSVMLRLPVLLHRWWLEILFGQKTWHLRLRHPLWKASKSICSTLCLCLSLYNHHKIQMCRPEEGPEGNCCLANVVGHQGKSNIILKRSCVLKHELIPLHPNILHAFSCLYNSSDLESSKAYGGDNQTHSKGFQRFFHACCASLYFFQRGC